MTMKETTPAQSRVEATMRLLERALLDGTWPAGTRLPAERVLAEQYAVARRTRYARRSSGSRRVGC